VPGAWCVHKHSQAITRRAVRIHIHRSHPELLGFWHLLLAANIALFCNCIDFRLHAYSIVFVYIRTTNKASLPMSFAGMQALGRSEDESLAYLIQQRAPAGSRRNTVPPRTLEWWSGKLETELTCPTFP